MIVLSTSLVSVGKLIVVEASSWLREASSVREVLDSTLVPVVSSRVVDAVAEGGSSGSRLDPVLLSEGTALTIEVASITSSDEVGTSDWISELVLTSERSVGWARTPVGVLKSEAINTELVLRVPSAIFGIVFSKDSDTVDTAEASSDTTLEGTFVAEGRIEISRLTSEVEAGEIVVSACVSAIEVIDGGPTISVKMLEGVGSLIWVRIPVGVIDSVSMGTETVLLPSRSFTELLISGESGMTVSEESLSEAALDGMSLAEGSVGASLMLTEVAGCASTLDVVNGSRPVVSARVLICGASDSSVELSTTTELMEMTGGYMLPCLLTIITNAFSS